MDKNLRESSQSWAPLLLPCPCNYLLGRGHSLNYCSKTIQSRSLTFYHPLQQLVWPFSVCRAPTRRGEKKKGYRAGFTWGSYFSTVARWDELSYPPTA